MALIATTNKTEFKDKVLDSDKVVLVDFWADWCPPCRMMVPILDSVADKMADGVDVVKVNIEEHQENGQIAAEYGVRSIPNLLVFKDGKVVGNMIGMMPESALVEELNKHL